MYPTYPQAARLWVNLHPQTSRLWVCGDDSAVRECAMSTTEIYSPGLEGVIAGETAISTIVDGLSYRGHSVTELVEKATFDEVAYLLLYDELPKQRELADFQKRIANARRLPESLRDLFKALPKSTPPMDALRTAVSILAHYDQDNTDLSSDA